MPVIRSSQRPLQEGNRPDWCKVNSAGVFHVPRKDGRFDCHYHDCNEYWLVFRGKAKIMSEGQEFYVRAGDIVCTKAGDEHDVLEVYEELEAFWFEDALPKGGRDGHLHRGGDKIRGHVVRAGPVPGDFPD